MKSINHHLTEDLLIGYSSGTLPEAVNLIVATHVSLCDTCRASLETYETLGGAVLEQTGGAALSDDCLQGALAMIRNAPASPKPKPRARDAVLPAPLLDYVGESLDDVRWSSIGMGVKQAILKTSEEATARLLYIPAGMAMPDHSHAGIELTMVLQGAFEDEDGFFARGDIEIADADVEHKPVAAAGDDCICLAVTDAPLKFKGLIPRLAQPFLRI